MTSISEVLNQLHVYCPDCVPSKSSAVLDGLDLICMGRSTVHCAIIQMKPNSFRVILHAVYRWSMHTEYIECALELSLLQQRILQSIYDYILPAEFQKKHNYSVLKCSEHLIFQNLKCFAYWHTAHKKAQLEMKKEKKFHSLQKESRKEFSQKSIFCVFLYSFLCWITSAMLKEKKKVRLDGVSNL